MNHKLTVMLYSYHVINVALPAPNNVKATVLTHDSVGVTWNQSPDATGYLISCISTVSRAGNRNMMVNGGDTTSYTINNLVENTSYVITVQSLTRGGRRSELSAKESIRTVKAGK